MPTRLPLLILLPLLALPSCTTHPTHPTHPAPPNPQVILSTTAGDITLELDPARAPISVANFLMHADRGDYDNTCFHRVIPTFVIQGGGWSVQRAKSPAPIAPNAPATPNETPAAANSNTTHTFTLIERAKLDQAAGRPDAPIKNEWPTGLNNTRGTLAMARDAAPDTATREFYINVADNPRLDTAREKTGNAGYAVFGRVVSGMPIVDTIRLAPTTDRPDILSDNEALKDVPIDPVIIKSVRRVSQQPTH